MGPTAFSFVVNVVSPDHEVTKPQTFLKRSNMWNKQVWRLLNHPQEDIQRSGLVPCQSKEFPQRMCSITVK